MKLIVKGRDVEILDEDGSCIAVVFSEKFARTCIAASALYEELKNTVLFARKG